MHGTPPVDISLDHEGESTSGLGAEIIFDGFDEHLPFRPGFLVPASLLVKFRLEVGAVCRALDILEAVGCAALRADEAIESGAQPLAFFLAAMFAFRHGNIR
tara:strand:- start:243 stop:548 length:306 start_codon:yes stop_codon:yes gene_type:complete